MKCLRVYPWDNVSVNSCKFASKRHSLIHSLPICFDICMVGIHIGFKKYQLLYDSHFCMFCSLYPVWQHTFVSPSAFSRRAVVSYWRKYVHEVLVNRLGGLSLPRKSVVRLTDRPDMTLDVYRGRKTTIQYNTVHCNGELKMLI